ncbi:Protein PAL1 [Teratosphaeria destructans]|uniref:Protein PAL1 n=1 Tax=Teratosphaeria destructans TaxID=418781 RepID=A0A9W7SYP2_9PEZI|nr:Protein PAL1 [Teratosphaeria destructans]
MANTTAVEGAILSANNNNQAYGYGQPSSNNLSTTFSSNNPFRNRATSPAQASQVPTPRPINMSNNPFLDASEVRTSNDAPQEQRNGMPHHANMAADIFVRITKFHSLTHARPAELLRPHPSCGSAYLDRDTIKPLLCSPLRRPTITFSVAHYGAIHGLLREHPISMTAQYTCYSTSLTAAAGLPPPPYSNGDPQRSGALPAPSSSRPSVTDGRREAPPRPPRAPASPLKRDAPRPRPRGMSESSVIDEKERRVRRERERERERQRERGPRPDRTESEERRRRERRREREERHRLEKEKVRNGDRSDRPGKKPQGLDIIDKLDVTGIYGSGLFHHDGPFDACNPHRNKAKSRRPAPMQAFPADSANMQLGGAGPLRSRLDLDRFHGRGEEGFSEYSATRKATTTNYINPTEKVEPIHGNESYGLGTSTFLEGAPASKSALQRRESDDQDVPTQNSVPNGGGLTRKKSLAQRLRGMSSTRRQGSGDMRSPDARYNDGLETSAVPQIGQKSISAGGPARARYTKENEINPFDNEYDSAFDKKAAQIRIAEQERRPSTGRARAPSSSKEAGLVRSLSNEVPARDSNEEQKPAAGGFLNRMRSIKGGRRSRPERRDT